MAFIRLTVSITEDGYLDFPNSDGDIFVADVDGGDVVRLTNSDGHEWVPA